MNPTIDGMLGGFAKISHIDIDGKLLIIYLRIGIISQRERRYLSFAFFYFVYFNLHVFKPVIGRTSTTEESPN